MFGRLAARGHGVTLLVSGWPGAPPLAELDGMHVHRVGSRYTFSLAAPRYYRAELASEPFDLMVEDLNKVPLFATRWFRGPLVLLVHHLFGATAFHEAGLPVAAATWVLVTLRRSGGPRNWVLNRVSRGYPTSAGEE